MKKILSIFLLLSVMAAGCKKEEDPCEGISCQNGGSCVSGTCNCVNGYTGEFCQTAPNPCATITCLNGGNCVSGACICQPGFSGANCGQVVPASALIVNSINVTRFPQTDGGGGWDLTSGPEVYITIETSTGSVVFDSPVYFEDATAPVLFTQGFPVTLQPGTSYTISCYDFDTTDADDFMAGMSGFIPGNYDNSGFPTTLSLTSTDLDVTLSVTWIH